MHFSRIGIICKRQSPAAWQMVQLLVQLLRKQGCSVQLDEESAKAYLPEQEQEHPSM